MSGTRPSSARGWPTRVGISVTFASPAPSKRPAPPPPVDSSSSHTCPGDLSGERGSQALPLTPLVPPVLQTSTSVRVTPTTGAVCTSASTSRGTTGAPASTASRWPTTDTTAWVSAAATPHLPGAPSRCSAPAWSVGAGGGPLAFGLLPVSSFAGAATPRRHSLGGGGALTTGLSFLTVLKARGLRSRCSLLCFFSEASQVDSQMATFLPGVHKVISLCVHVFGVFLRVAVTSDKVQSCWSRAHPSRLLTWLPPERPCLKDSRMLRCWGLGLQRELGGARFRPQ